MQELILTASQQCVAHSWRGITSGRYNVQMLLCVNVVLPALRQRMKTVLIRPAIFARNSVRKCEINIFDKAVTSI